MNWNTILLAFNKLTATVKQKADAEKQTQEMSNKIYTDSEIKLSDKAVGAKAELVNADGTLAPCPNGDYEMTDGSKFTVKDGLITVYNGDKAVKTDPIAADETKVEAAAPAAAPDLASMQAQMDVLTAGLAEVKAMCEANAQGNMKANEDAKLQSEASTKFSEDFSKQLDAINDTLKLLATTPAEFSRTNEDNIVKDSKEDKMNEFAKMFSTLQNHK